MKLAKIALSFGIFALGVASAASGYKLTLATPTQVGDTQLKPGEYKVQMAGDKAVFTSGNKTVAEVPAKLETGGQKYAYTTMEASDSKLKEIRVGGTNSKILLMPAGEHAQNK